MGKLREKVREYILYTLAIIKLIDMRYYLYFPGNSDGKESA